MTDLAPQTDQMQVQAPHERWIGREEFVHSLVWIVLCSDESEPPRDSPDVRIDWKVGPIEREEHHDPGRLPPHPGK